MGRLAGGQRIERRGGERSPNCALESDPLKDYNPTRTFPIVTLLLMAACIGIYFFVQPHKTSVEDAEFSFKNAAIPCEIVTAEPLSAQEITSGRCLRGGEPVFDDQGEFTGYRGTAKDMTVNLRRASDDNDAAGLGL